MPRLTVSLPVDLLTKLDRLAKRERHSRSELLCEAARRYLSQPEEASTRPPNMTSPRTARHTQKWTAAKLTQYLVDKGIVTRGCPGLDAIVGPVTEPVDMERVLEIGKNKKLKGLSQQIIDDREDRV
jgi:Arc/MetJ-type ribon-helix-helix transcriptional regulator